MRKLFITLGLFATFSLGTAFITSCGNNETDCDGFNFVNQRAINLLAASQTITGSVVNTALDITQFTTVPYEQGSAIAIADLGIAIYYDLEVVARHEAPVTFGNQAFACSPPALANMLESVIITADQTFRGMAPGAELNTFFRFSLDSNVVLDPVNGALMDGATLFYQLVEAPETTQDFVFTFDLLFQDGSRNQVSTSTIRVSQ